MASASSMEAPICLVENENEELRVNPKAINILERITQPVVVVAIVGLYRTGKSYLMNRLAGQNHGECHPQTGQRPFGIIGNAKRSFSSAQVKPHHVSSFSRLAYHGVNANAIHCICLLKYRRWNDGRKQEREEGLPL